MRYYYYGKDMGAGNDSVSAQTLSGSKTGTSARMYNDDLPWRQPVGKVYQRNSNLVIEEDTVYEIDENCMNCKKNPD